ncbi:MAG: hypothetical protein WBF67_11925 [Olleya sp.]
MVNDSTALALCVLTLLLFFIGGITGLLTNPYYIGIVVVVYLVVIINLIMIKSSDSENHEFLEKDIKK